MRSKAEVYQFIQEQVAYYAIAPTTRRAFDEGVRRYMSRDGVRFSPVGRYLISPADVQRDSAALMTIRLVLRDGVEASRQLDRFLRLEGVRYPVKIWADLEELHRSDACWCAGGLSRHGRGFVDEMYGWLESTGLLVDQPRGSLASVQGLAYG